MVFLRRPSPSLLSLESLEPNQLGKTFAVGNVEIMLPGSVMEHNRGNCLCLDAWGYGSWDWFIAPHFDVAGYRCKHPRHHHWVYLMLLTFHGAGFSFHWVKGAYIRLPSGRIGMLLNASLSMRCSWMTRRDAKLPGCKSYAPLTPTSMYLVIDWQDVHWMVKLIPCFKGSLSQDDIHKGRLLNSSHGNESILYLIWSWGEVKQLCKMFFPPVWYYIIKDLECEVLSGVSHTYINITSLV